ncbi:MAG: T9SS type A sorting domain-containing protein, partial [Bacteroidota bacterium]|nr:T9SS type A sorting domain-containing protein [Bacteroidota bacterium]
KFSDESVPSEFAKTIGATGAIGPDNISTNPNLPKEYSLKQNYPNPFNPVTNIHYELPFDNFVTIKVFDILGKEITTLVNEIKNAGSYIVSFNGSGLSSGIYYYKIEAGNFTEIRKMLLIK